ncbi:MAG TPA: TMEM175 family protein [Thermomicrobiaceae bacterium]|nr:TMEM175 family protein [Thermomicrobiaceae bacterium]
MTGTEADRVAPADAGGTARRLEAFSDGVFAIAVTLLVLDLKVPQLVETAQGTHLLGALGDQWPVYLAYVTSFATILIMWINHHTIFDRVKRVDHALFLLNGLLLLCITFVPFPTALLAEYLGHPGEHTAAAVYAGTYVLLAVVFNALWRYAARRDGLLDPSVSPDFVQRVNRLYLFGPGLYGVAFLFAFIQVEVSFGICVALAVVFALPNSAGEMGPAVSTPEAPSAVDDGPPATPAEASAEPADTGTPPQAGS